jgi:hypothetical protein
LSKRASRFLATLGLMRILIRFLGGIIANFARPQANDSPFPDTVKKFINTGFPPYTVASNTLKITLTVLSPERIQSSGKFRLVP